MLHIHFGAGRLGLGVVAPYFRSHQSELHILDRAASGARETGGTDLAPERRNELLPTNPDRAYVLQSAGADSAEREVEPYDG